MKKNNEILISIITVVYNGEAYLEQTIKSVLMQTYKNIEYIIIDGGSTDGTVDIIKRYEENLSYWISEKDSGIYDAMNKGILKANGDFVGIINADDYYLDNVFEEITNIFLKNKHVDVVYGDMFLMTKEGLKKELGSNMDDLHINMSIMHPSVFINRNLYGIKLFNTNYKLCADYDLILNYQKNGFLFYHVEKPLTVMREGGASSQFSKTNKETFDIQSLYFTKATAYKNLYLKKIKRAIRKIIEKVLGNKTVLFIKGFK